MEIAITHYEALKSFLATHLAREQTNGSRTNAREKLTKLSKQQFQELSTDVYDELTRRLLDSNEVPFLPVRDEFHPKRNQARQKLATLPKNRFKDLASDVYYELERRYPELLDIDRKIIEGTTSGYTPKSNTIVPEMNGKPPEYGTPKSPRSRTQSTTSSVSDFGRRYNNMSMSSVSSGDSRNRDTSTSHVSQKSVGKPDTVNFASLDSLMADLGDMIDKRQNDNSPRSHTPSNSGQITLNERLRSEFESRITALQKRIKELESDKGGNSVADNVANDVQKEASTLLEEIKLLSMQNDDLYSEKEQDSAKIKTLTVEVNEWKSKYEKVKIELRNLKATSSFFKETPKIDVIKDNSLAPTPDGAIDESKIIAYQISIDDLLRAGRSDVPANVLMAMKSIVIACKSITEEVDQYEQRKISIMKTEDKDKLYSLKTKLSATLTNLMTAAKNHATGYGISPVSLLDAAASHLTASVVDLVKLVKLRRSNKNTDGRNGDFLERQTESIVQAIQTLLAAIRNQSHGNELTDNINTITTIVLNVIAVCQDSFNSPIGTPYRTRGDTILKELGNSIDKLDEMRETISNNSEDFLSNKISKQRLASASFEIAKFTKELVGLIE
ncbi:4490_t:CDS:10 [Diversispora eburnea]|uniref:4490_t:CDS:1 n=1 Tax=Diversispora eburnea TaxID=1213867 RepID=A0A9N8WFM1_9GLOM|nr:4490_t:CDS:10 [Diversispora eburnea]